MRYLVDALIFMLLSLFAMLWSGCISGMGYSTEDRVTAAAREYGQGVRWGRLEDAAIHLKAEQKKRFYDRHKEVEDELEINDWELISLDVDKSDKKKTRATARCEYQWTLKRQGLLQKTSTEQKWEELGGHWVMLSETRTRGKPLTLFDEPSKEAAAK
jgi:hypothetical protein